MKKAVLLSIGLLTIILLLSCSMLRVNALNSNEWSSSVSWSSQVYYQGDSGTVTVTFYSTCPDQLKISYVGINFDWMAANTYYQDDLSSSPVPVATDSQYTFSAISFSIPSDATVGQHSYTILIQGQEQGLLGWYSISVTSGAGSINVNDAYEKVYDQTVQGVQNSLNNAQNSNLSPDAQALLQQANNMYNQATTLAGQGEWQSAVNDLNSASNYISQALALPTPTAPEFPTITVLAIFLVLSLFAVIMLTVRKRKIISAFKG